jgi:uncharacterized protein
MGDRTSYTPGTFSWVELVTSDADAAKAFYSELLGWEYRDTPLGEGAVYSTALRDGKDVGALYASEQGPPRWNCYVTVASADEAAERAAGLGATVVAEPFDVMDVGRMATITDGLGAMLFLWEARSHIGASLVNAPGALAWNDLLTADPEASERFYGELFGWSIQEIPGAGGYRSIGNAGNRNGGMMPISPELRERTPTMWIPYFGHDDVAGLVARVPELGGRVLNGPVQVPGGTFLVLADPQGATFAVLDGNYDD